MNETLSVRNRRSNRARKMLWSTTPFNMAVANKLGKDFFRLLKKTFLLYSCMPYCSIGPKYVVSERKGFTEKKNSKLEF